LEVSAAMLTPRFRKHVLVASLVSLGIVALGMRETRLVQASAPSAISAGVAHGALPVSHTVQPLPAGSLDWVSSARVRKDIAIDFYAVNTRESASVSLGFDGTISEHDEKALENLFRCRRSNRRHSIDRGLLIKIADLAEHYPGQTIEVVSAYRHPPHASRTSKHRRGRALDLRVSGAPDREVRDYLWTRWNEEVGVGFYRSQGFIHLDHRPGEIPTAWTQFGASRGNVYNPGWARRLDRSRPRHES